MKFFLPLPSMWPVPAKSNPVMVSWTRWSKIMMRTPNEWARERREAYLVPYSSNKGSIPILRSRRHLRWMLGSKKRANDLCFLPFTSTFASISIDNLDRLLEMACTRSATSNLIQRIPTRSQSRSLFNFPNPFQSTSNTSNSNAPIKKGTLVKRGSNWVYNEGKVMPWVSLSLLSSSRSRTKPPLFSSE